MTSKKNDTFETALDKLEKIAHDMESGVLSLEESIEKYEEGIKLAKYCKDKLDDAEQKIEILQKGKNGKVAKKVIEVKKNSGEIENDDEVQGSLL